MNDNEVFYDQHIAPKLAAGVGGSASSELLGADRLPEKSNG